MLEGLSETP